MQTDYQKCYGTLGLSRDASFATAKRVYRQQVNRWHPDRHDANSNNNVAKSRFIELTNAYNALRKYYRQHKRMPLARSYDSENLVNSQNRSDSLLNSARTRENDLRLIQRRRQFRIATLVAAAVCALCVLIFLFSLDTQLSAKANAEAQKVIKSAPPSRFETIPGQSKKGIFLTNEPTGSALVGDSGGSLIEQ